MLLADATSNCASEVTSTHSTANSIGGSDDGMGVDDEQREDTVIAHKVKNRPLLPTSHYCTEHFCMVYD